MGGVFGQQDLASGNTPFNELSFVVQMMMAKMNVATLVQVVAVETSGRTAAVGTVVGLTGIVRSPRSLVTRRRQPSRRTRR